jgi:hyperosmotically inducible periplasmic protein
VVKGFGGKGVQLYERTMMQKKHLPAVRSLVVCAAMLPGILMTAPAFAQAPDNTSANKEDRSAAAPNADKAKNGTSDRQLMAHIRRDVVKDKSLSLDAHNVKIVAQNGKVTLRGPVKSDEEKHAIELIAAKYAGDGNVDNQLTVAAK